MKSTGFYKYFSNASFRQNLFLHFKLLALEVVRGNGKDKKCLQRLYEVVIEPSILHPARLH